MKKTVTPLRSLCAALAALVLLLALAVPAFAAENGFADLYYRLNDSAEVLTEDEDSELEASLEELSVRQSFDVTIATIDSLESEGYTSMEEYADDLYDYCQFGYGADHWSGDGADRDRRDEGPAQERGTAAGRNRLCAAGQHEADQPAGSVPVPGRAPHRAAKGDQLRRFRRQFHPHLLQRLDPWRRWRFILKKYRGLL